MTTQEALKYFNNSKRQLAEALGLSTQAVQAWGDKVPKLREYEIKEILTKRGAS